VKGLIRAEVSAEALRSNLLRIRTVASGCKVMAVIKANAYGHGLVQTARCLEGADAFGVARLEEALALRAAGVKMPIVLLEGVLDAGDLAEAARHDLQLIVHDAFQIDLLERQLEGRFIVWLKVDTGMNRLGLAPGAFRGAFERLSALRERVAEIRLLTHFACADRRDLPMTVEQLSHFNELTQGMPNARSLANSAAIFAFPDAHADWVRPGLALYGVSPFVGGQGAELGLTPAMQLRSTVIGIRDVTSGGTVGYGASWRAQRDSRIAIVAAGYGDGLPWSLPSGTGVVIGGRVAPLAGRVSMDMIAVDVTGMPVHIGDEVVLWGAALPVEVQAQAAGTIPWELLCAVSQRVPLLVR